MSEEKDEKRLLNEILPDPKQAASNLASGTPRKRTVEHLRRILTASLVAPVAASAMSHATQATQNPPPPPPPPPFFVVDPPPPPPPRPKPGYLSIKSTPVAEIEIDGKATGLKTPQAMIELTPGSHTVKLKAGELQQTFTVQIEPEKTRSEERNLEPPKDSK